MKAFARGLAATALLFTLTACADLGGAFGPVQGGAGAASVGVTTVGATPVGATYAESPTLRADAGGAFADPHAPYTTAFAQSYAVGHASGEPAAVLPAVEMPSLVDEDVIHGDVSWYGKRFAGRRTANGETFDPAKLTMAHRELPFGTRVRVTNPANGQSVIVRVNDRGPYVGDRVADLSHAAAKKIGMVNSGVIAAELEVLEEGGAGEAADARTSAVSATATPGAAASPVAASAPVPGALAPNANGSP